MIGMNPLGKSQGQLSKEAKDASANAEKVCSKACDADAKSHEEAGRAHSDAAYKNREAGNETKAKEHEKLAHHHYDKADEKRQVDYFAKEQSRKAEALSQKARMEAYGADKDEPRSEKELHEDAARAHLRASKFHELAENHAAVKYHQDQAAAHSQAAKGDA